MNLHNLAERQEEMRDKWEERRRHPITKKAISADERDRLDTLKKIERAERGELVCRRCKKNKPIIMKRTGEVLPCRRCDYADGRDRAKLAAEWVDPDTKDLTWARKEAARMQRSKMRKLCAKAA